MGIRYKWTDRRASGETTRTSTRNLTPCSLLKTCQETGRGKMPRVWKHLDGVGLFGTFYFQTPLNKVDESILKNVCVSLSLVSENTHLRLNQLPKVMMPDLALRLYRQCNTGEVSKSTFLLISKMESLTSGKLSISIVLPVSLSTHCLLFLMYTEAFSFNYRK